MAIKASATITLSFMVDVKATYRYYKLQASTAATPSVPTTNPPSGWTDTEPSYTSGSTNTLYTVDLTVFTNDTFLYSAVSKSSSYEAAKEAYNKAQNAQNTANSANDKVDNLEVGGRNLLINSSFTENTTSWSNTGASIATIDGVKCARIIGALNKTQHVNQNVITKINVKDLTQEYVFSADVRLDNYVAGTTNPYVQLYFSGSDGSWIGATTVSGDQYIQNHSGEGWIRLKWVVKFTRTPTSMSIYVYARDFTGELYFKNLKLELGNRATDWTPSPEDVDDKIDDAQNAADNAQNKADDAYDKADEASKVATNYIKYEDNSGLIVGDMTTGTLTKNVRIDADSVDIRDGDVELASFSANRIDLGKTSPDATISMRDGNLEISNFGRGDLDYTQIGCYGNFDVSAIVNESTEMFKRGGILTTIEANTNAEWQHLIGMRWSDLSSETWSDLQSSSGSIDKGEFFETRIYADNTDRTTANGFNTARIYLRNAKNASTNRITSEIGIEADEVTVESPLYVTGDIHTPSIRTSSEYNWLGRYRFNTGWIGFYSTPLNASTNSSRLGWMGYDNSTTNFTISNAGGGNNYVNKAWTVSSDRRLKKDVEDIPDIFVNVWRELEPKVFRWNHLNYDVDHLMQFGLIAQDVISIFNKYGLDFIAYNFVNIIEIDGVEYFSITYDHYHMLTALALKAAMNKLDSFESRLERLEALIK